MADYTIRREGMPLDLACWLHYGVGRGDDFELPAGAVERVLAANPHLAMLPSTLPLGTVVSMPELAVNTRTSVVRLWD